MCFEKSVIFLCCNENDRSWIHVCYSASLRGYTCPETEYEDPCTIRMSGCCSEQCHFKKRKEMEEEAKSHQDCQRLTDRGKHHRYVEQFLKDNYRPRHEDCLRELNKLNKEMSDDQRGFHNVGLDWDV